MKDDNYFKEQRKKGDKLNLGELVEIVDDISAKSMTLFFEKDKLGSIHAIIKHGINNHIMYKIQKLYNLDLISVNPHDEEHLELILDYTGE